MNEGEVILCPKEMFSDVLCVIVAGYFKLGLSRNTSVAEYTNFSNPVKD